MRKCERCAEQVQDEALVCKHCGHNFDPVEVNTLKAKRQRNSFIKAVTALLCIAAVIAYCSRNAAHETVSTATSSPTSPPNASGGAAGGQTAPVSNWAYDSQEDPLRKRMQHLAMVTSNNSHKFDFPYGDVTLQIVVRSHPQWGQDVIFKASDGQILCHYNNCGGMISFDGKAERLSLNESADNDPKVVFASYGPAIIKKLKHSKEVIVELPFYREGNRQFVFNTSGLEWPRASEK